MYYDSKDTYQQPYQTQAQRERFIYMTDVFCDWCTVITLILSYLENWPKFYLPARFNCISKAGTGNMDDYKNVILSACMKQV